MEQEKFEQNPVPMIERQAQTETLQESSPWRLRDFKGFLHFHSWEGSSCGKDNLKKIKLAVAQKTGLSYLAMAEHVGWPGEEYWPEKIASEFSDIDQINAEGTPPYIFKGIEANVMPDGSIDAAEELLTGADIVVASMHYKNTDRPEEMTAQNTVARWCSVMDNYGDVSVLGHPLRDLPPEEWPKMDWDKLCAKAKEKNTAIELSISDSAPAELPAEFFEALHKHNNLVVVAPDFHSLYGYLSKEGGLSEEQSSLLEQYYTIKGDIAGITFNEGEKIKGRLRNPDYTEAEKADKITRLRALRAKLQEIEDSEELARIYEILSSNVQYNQDESGQMVAKRKPFSFQLLRKYAKKIDQLRRPVDDGGGLAINKSNIINLWDQEKLANWIQTRKSISAIEKKIHE